MAHLDAVASRDPQPLWMIMYILAVCIVIAGLTYLSLQQEHKARRRQEVEGKGAIAVEGTGEGGRSASQRFHHVAPCEHGVGVCYCRPAG